MQLKAKAPAKAAADKAAKAAPAKAAAPVAAPAPVAAKAPKLNPASAARVSAFETHGALRDFMRAQNLVATSPQFHTDHKRKAAVRVAGHRDNAKTASDLSERSVNLLRGFCGVPSHRSAAFPAHGLDNSILAMLAAAGLVTITGGNRATDAAGVTTATDAGNDCVTVAVTDAGRAFVAPVKAAPAKA
ncbi:hypothetical protein RCDURKIN_141 [Rhodobacter phage RcDurkin]|nr:hypothetical protein RCDURKIN_141 [Rhodobacter phage RcDurkin]